MHKCQQKYPVLSDSKVTEKSTFSNIQGFWGGITYIIFWFSVAVSSELIQFVDHLVDGVSIQAHVRIDLACSSHKSSNSNCNNIAINLHKSSPCSENWQNLCIAGNGVLEYKNFIGHVWQTGIRLSPTLMRILQFSIPTFCHVSL